MKWLNDTLDNLATYVIVGMLILIVIWGLYRPGNQVLLEDRPTSGSGWVDNLAPMPTRVAIATPDDDGHVWRIDSQGRLLPIPVHRNENNTTISDPTPIPIPVKELTADISSGHEVYGSALFKSRIGEAVHDLSKYDAPFELISRAGHFTITENSTPCDRSHVEGCAILGPQKIELKNHSDPMWMKIVLIHEIAHIALGTSECDAVKEEITYMNSDRQYDGWHLRNLIEERLGRVC